MLIWLYRLKINIKGMATHVLEGPRPKILHGLELRNVGHTYMHNMVLCYHKMLQLILRLCKTFFLIVLL